MQHSLALLPLLQPGDCTSQASAEPACRTRGPTQVQDALKFKTKECTRSVPKECSCFSTPLFYLVTKGTRALLSQFLSEHPAVSQILTRSPFVGETAQWVRTGSDLEHRSLGFLFILLGCLKFGFSFASELNRVFVGHKMSLLCQLYGSGCREMPGGCGRWWFSRPANH